MARRLPRILFVGERAPFRRLIEPLESLGRYHFEYASAAPSTPSFDRRTPDAVLIEVSAEAKVAEQVLAWANAFKTTRPVVVISSRPDMSSYLAAMERGAFDYLTCQTSLDEVIRVLDNAIRWQPSEAA